VKKKEIKREATLVAKKLVNLAVSTARTDPALAKEQAESARKVMLKFNIRFDWSLKRFYCHGCKKLLIPGMNARVRLAKREKIIRVTCSDCGCINRKTFQKKSALNMNKGGLTSLPQG
jgi:RNase P subunit RPR2